MLSLDDIKEKIKETNMDKYGCENVFSSDIIKSKIKDTNIKRYGYVAAMMNPDIKEKLKNTCLERYGKSSYGAFYSSTHKKELSATWKGGVQYTRCERASFEYNNWRRLVFARDEYTCICCKAKNGNGTTVILHAHHVKNWKDNEDSRYDVENGVTLCDKCHYKFHSIYSKKK